MASANSLLCPPGLQKRLFSESAPPPSFLQKSLGTSFKPRKKNELKRTRGSNLVGGETRRGSGKESGLSILRLCFVFATWSELH